VVIIYIYIILYYIILYYIYMHVADDLNPWENVCFFLDLLIRYKLRQFPGFVQDEKISCTKYTRDAMDGTPKVNALQFF